MGIFLVRYDSRVVLYDRRAVKRLATDLAKFHHFGKNQKLFYSLKVNLEFD